MNAMERIKGTLAFEETDRVAAIPQVFGQAARLAGVPLRDYVRQGEQLARCQLRALKVYGHDAVFALMDASVETEAAGSVLTYPWDGYPYIGSYAVTDTAGIAGLAVPDPWKAGRMPELLKAAGILRRELGCEVPVVGCVLGPMTLAMQLIGAEKAIYLAIDRPEEFAALLDFATEVAISFGTAQLEAGVHLPLVFDPSASPDIIPPQFFRELELPRLERVFAAFKEAGSLANWLHIAGPTAPILPYYPQAGVEIANLDYCVDPLAARRILPRTCLNGNLKSFSFLDAVPETIAADACRLLAEFQPGDGFILSSGCEIPPEASPEGVAAMMSTVSRRWACRYLP